MKIYTKKGDGGETGLFGGRRVPKHNIRVEAYGTVDELNAIIGVTRSKKPKSEIDTILRDIQIDLYILGSDLAAPSDTSGSKIPRIEDRHVVALEQHIDVIEQQLPPLTSFIMPGGVPVAADLHHARTVCRRAERIAFNLAQSESVNPQALVYFNRLSDLLFVLARYANKLEGGSEQSYGRDI
jgi:cob(I)alamin adenosyltransferase